MAVAPSSSSLNLFIVGLVFLLVVAHLFLLHVSGNAGFSHRGSPKLHPASTPLPRLNSSIRRSASYNDYLRTANPGNANSPLVSINNEDSAANPDIANTPHHKGFSALVTSYHSHYLVAFQIGHDGHNVSAVLEVAEDFIWLFCKPCPTCPARDHPIFDPLESDTYKIWDCNDDYCKTLENYHCDDNDKCHFSHRYNPGTAIGTLSQDTVTMRSAKDKHRFHLKNVKFGCTYEIEGNQFKDSMGVLGLGSGYLSLVSQMGARGFDKRFSYCLPSNHGSRSYLYFGTAAKRHHNIMISTPLDSSEPPFHEINLTEIYVGIDGHRRPTDDNIVISTSIFYTYIGDDSLQFISGEIRKLVTLPYKPQGGYDICYDTSNAPVNFKMPEIKLIFRDNAELVLEEDNAFVRFDNALCLTILSNKITRGTSILGSLAQKGHLMLFDVDKGNLGFSYNNDLC